MPIVATMRLLDLALTAIPALISVGAVLFGFRQVRQLRHLTGDKGRLTAIMGFTRHRR